MNFFSGMDVGARNRLLECSDCHSLYHQECHKPGVTEDSFENWVCFNCKVNNFITYNPEADLFRNVNFMSFLIKSVIFLGG